jgi:polyferredoxin
MKAYTVVLLALLGLLGFLMHNRGTMEAKFIKPAGSTFFIRDGKITNTYNYTFLNKSNEDKTVTIKVIKPKNGEVKFSGSEEIILQRDQIIKGTVNVSFPKSEMNSPKQKIIIGVYDQNGKELSSFDTYFQGPFRF